MKIKFRTGGSLDFSLWGFGFGVMIAGGFSVFGQIGPLYGFAGWVTIPE